MTFRFPTQPVALAALLAACGGGGGGGGSDSPTAPPPPPADGSIVTVEVSEHRFEPRQVTVDAGQTVRWVYRGQDPTHTVTARDGSFDSGFAFETQGDAFQHTFGAADDGETFEYSCASHADCCDMKGAVRVGGNAPPPDPGYG